MHRTMHMLYDESAVCQDGLKFFCIASFLQQVLGLIAGM